MQERPTVFPRMSFHLFRATEIPKAIRRSPVPGWPATMLQGAKAILLWQFGVEFILFVVRFLVAVSSVLGSGIGAEPLPKH